MVQVLRPAVSVLLLVLVIAPVVLFFDVVGCGMGMGRVTFSGESVPEFGRHDGLGISRT